jgi:hypothetical protein
MRLVCVCLLLLTIPSARPAIAQQASPAAAAAQELVKAPDSGFDLPVSLDRIREALKKAPERPLLSSLERAPDFTIEVEKQVRLDAILSKLDFSGSPAPGGGLYGYEQQRRLFDPVSQPLMQPYAAYSGGQLVTVALQNLIGRYLGGRVLAALSRAEQARTAREAREEVDQAIAAYCAAHPVRDAIQLCTRGEH